VFQLYLESVTTDPKGKPREAGREAEFGRGGLLFYDEPVLLYGSDAHKARRL
jgi:hypothetical protein